MKKILALVCVSTVFSIQAQTKRPNVLFIAFDDLKPVMGCYGDKMAITPVMDRLAANGMVFTNSHCQQAVCGPTRASLLTGMRPDYTKIWDLETKMRDKNPDILTIPQYFKQNGYHTVGVGKVFDGRCVDGPGKQDEISWSEPFLGSPGALFADTAYSKERVANKLRNVHSRPSVEAADVPDETYKDPNSVNVAIAKITELSKNDKPFFFAMGFIKPHLPFTAPKKYWDMYRRDQFKLPAYRTVPLNAPAFALHNSTELRNGYTDIPLEGPISDEKQLELIHGYYATVSFVDYHLGRLLDALEKEGLLENTIIVLWGDHGWHLGDHGLFCKHTNYEQATRSPLIITAPGMKTNMKSATPVEFVDIFPTLCDLAKLPIPKNLHGTSLVPLMNGKKIELKKLACSQFPRVVDGKDVMGYSYRSDRYRYVEWIKKDFYHGQTEGEVIARELYDYKIDPNETINQVDNKEYAKTVSWFEIEKQKVNNKTK